MADVEFDIHLLAAQVSAQVRLAPTDTLKRLLMILLQIIGAAHRLVPERPGLPSRDPVTPCECGPSDG